MDDPIGLCSLVGMDEVDAPDEEGLIDEYIHDDNSADDGTGEDEYR